MSTSFFEPTSIEHSGWLRDAGLNFEVFAAFHWDRWPGVVNAVITAAWSSISKRLAIVPESS
jgi:hypothetical protein